MIKCVIKIVSYSSSTCMILAYDTSHYHQPKLLEKATTTRQNLYALYMHLTCANGKSII
jgi:hypothetical protein